ncbi:RCC1-like G exchanging factor-like protein [Saccoglossus kowalevskii]|uniref:Williams-Beuren syndrome chromosomal region 16 protein homolog n=1 Tax=Saccoglossus kowalevskii TaxID=10224 RepID=A0ABM0MLZ6_SACKO|nr:PREDICTED: Williams-Beuren syndrome chromosomal region 16 protein homolog [Saccoglossus kowalevskii]
MNSAVWRRNLEIVSNITRWHMLNSGTHVRNAVSWLRHSHIDTKNEHAKLKISDGNFPLIQKHLQNYVTRNGDLFCRNSGCHFHSFTSSTLLHLQHNNTVFSKRHRRKKNIYEMKPKQTKDDVENMDVFQYVGERSKPARRLYVWGYAHTGALGIPTFVKVKGTGKQPRKYQVTPYRLDLNDRISKVACGCGFTLFSSRQTNSRKVWGTGMNTDSQLGLQTISGTAGRVLDYVIQPATIDLPLYKPLSTRVVQVACGRAHSIILTDQEGVFSIGNNSYGQCGRPVIENEKYQANPTMHRIKQLGNSVVQICCGHDHSLFLTEDGRVYSCGWGADGQTGLGHFNTVSEVSELEGDIKGEKITKVTSFSDCCLALSENGKVFGWGNSEYNQLSRITQHSQVNTPIHLPFDGVGKVVDIATGGTMCAILNDAGSVFVWGYGILGKGPNLSQSHRPEHIPDALFGKTQYKSDVQVTKIVCGLHHFAAVNSLGELFTWGRNDNGCLGLGHRNDQYFPLKVHLAGEVIEVSCGADHTVVLAKTFI